MASVKRRTGWPLSAGVQPLDIVGLPRPPHRPKRRQHLPVALRRPPRTAPASRQNRTGRGTSPRRCRAGSGATAHRTAAASAPPARPPGASMPGQPRHQAARGRRSQCSAALEKISAGAASRPPVRHVGLDQRGHKPRSRPPWPASRARHRPRPAGARSNAPPAPAPPRHRRNPDRPHRPRARQLADLRQQVQRRAQAQTPKPGIGFGVPVCCARRSRPPHASGSGFRPVGRRPSARSAPWAWSSGSPQPR